jgi:hypothetical protein
MVKTLPRFLLAFASITLLLGGVIHASAFHKAASALAAVDLPSFYANSFKALWLIDSATLIALAIVFGIITARPLMATRWTVVLLALIPAATAVLIYTFVGRFFPAHMLAVASVAAVLGGLRYPGSKQD